MAVESKAKRYTDRYSELLRVTRFRKSAAERTPTLSVEAASDRGRLLFSNTFRRLQSKTQVFDPQGNAGVRNRLTHSLEVATVGRYLAQSTTQKMVERGWLGDDAGLVRELTSAAVTFVEVACLMHDLGNPPFGHFGESTIQDWFSKKKESYRKQFDSSVHQDFDRMYKDFVFFDGNPQGLRLVTKLQWVKDEFGFNLTHTQLAAAVKYPWTPTEIGTEIDGKSIKKCGVFFSEEEAFSSVCKELRLDAKSRHPLSYLMEAADDISYCLSDIEDALEKNVIRGRDFVDWISKKKSNTTDSTVLEILGKLENDFNSTAENVSVFGWYVGFRTNVTNALVRDASNLFLDLQDDVLTGKYFDLLDYSEPAKQLLGAVKDFSKKHLYTNPIVRERELVGFEVLSGILDRFGIILDLPANDAYELLTTGEFTNKTAFGLAPTLVSFLGKKQLLAYKHNVESVRATSSDDEKKVLMEWVARAHLLVDFVSGMTDDFAVATFQRLYAGGLRSI